MHRWSYLLILFLIGIVVTATASAHAMLESSEPGAGAILETSPTAIVLHFDSLIELVFCGITVENTANSRKITGPIQSAGREHRSIKLGLPVLPSGNYRVIWNAVGRDGHRTSGEYKFSIK